MNCICCNRKPSQASVESSYIHMFFKTVCEKCNIEGIICGSCSSCDNYNKYKYCEYCRREIQINKIINYE